MNPLILGIDGFLNGGRLVWLLVVPLLVLLYIFLSRRKNRSGIRFTNTSILSMVLPKQSQWVRHLTVALAILSLVTLIAAWARPMGIDRVPRERATIVLVIDTSQSMTATDVAPTRMDAAKTAAIEFVDSLPPAYNVSVVALSGNPSVRLPPVTDRAAVAQIINLLEPADGTAIGDAIYAALGAIDQAPKGDDGSPAPGLIVLLSDGQNTVGQAPAQAAQDAANRKVPIYSISYGTDNGYVDLDAERIRVPPDPAQLEQVSSITNGKTYTADNASQLKDAYKAIGSDVGYVEKAKEVTANAAGVGLIFALLAALGALVLGARWA